MAEGPKLISELITEGVKLHSFFSSEETLAKNPDNFLVTQTELQKISALKTANTSLAVFEIPKPKKIDADGLIVALDSVRDPGNLGTIIRLCDWFGVSQLLCSKDTADCYNPKVVQATMGSIVRVSVHYLDLVSFLRNYDFPIYGAVMEGRDVYTSELEKEGVLVMGNEANGISSEVAALLNQHITIPRFGNLQVTESLNVATATAVLLSEFRRTIET